MSKRFFMLVAAAAVFSLAFGSESANAQFSDFGFPAGGASCGAGCATGPVGASQHSFGYGQMSERFRATQAQNDKIYARNAAWPKPFACGSRQHYHNIWRPMFDAGWEDQCILTSVHFDKNGDLTRYGKQQISGMVMNMPKSRRIIYVQETANNTETQSRVAKVENVIQTWFSQRGGMVQVSTRTPATMNGVRAVTITENAASSQPAPIIPIADGSSGVSSAVTQ